MKKIFLATILSLMYSSAIAQTEITSCSVIPSCESLGYVYTEAECEGKGIVKCPFNSSKLWCDDITYKTCEFGDYIYADKKCYKKSPPGDPVGVVLDPINRFAIYPYATKNVPYLNSSDYNSASAAGELTTDQTSELWNTQFVYVREDGTSDIFDADGHLTEEAQKYVNDFPGTVKPSTTTKCQTERGQDWFSPPIGAFYYYAKQASQEEIQRFNKNIKITLSQVVGVYTQYVAVANIVTNPSMTATTTKTLRLLCNDTPGNAVTVSLMPNTVYAARNAGTSSTDYANNIATLRCVMKY